MDTRLEVQKLDSLPPMSVAAHELLTAMSDSDLDLRAIAAIIEKDPALLARIIGLANSAYFGYPERVTTAEDAIFHVLGLKMARSLALSMVLSGPFRTEHCPEFDSERYWVTAMMTAAVAERLARYVTVEPLPQTGSGYLAGLLHNLGILAMVHLYPLQMGQVFHTYAKDRSVPLAALEQEALTATHTAVGGWLGRKWRLPNFTVAVMENHLNADYRGEYRSLVQLVGFGSAWANSLFNGSSGHDLSVLTALGIPAAEAERVLGEMLGVREELSALARVVDKG